ncbi:hypothetical protein AZH53_01455 [Methanomicrobiaceae archaeon CYW5]|uniref:RAD55 family ATPase n=1 Tax=Methanovulcanius yangii TaxID=1789227 RepID=UPI0029C9C24B|nr:ATPase domain-containing protein [Methanovulcanius yangii]MBT8507096.1 hypothetical protein [Methanovulcanius yangii]
MSSGVENIEIMASNKVSTGIAGLDFQLGGGYPAGSIIVLHGSPLSGIEEMAAQFWKTPGDGTHYYLMIDGLVEEGMVKVSTADVEEAINACSSSKRVIVDSLSSVVLKEGVDEAIRLMKETSRPIVEHGGNTLFVLYSGVHPDIEEIRIARHADVFVTCVEEIHGSEVERKLMIRKLRDAEVPNRMYPYNISSEGIDLSTTARVV